MNVEIVKAVSFKRVRVFVALSIVAAKPENLIRPWNAIRKNDREVDWIDIALTKDNAKLRM
ncbi:MAG: hypothetical protein LAO21_23100 [Acidobacteriia bacterium]|nr:hypothetical protein [Terriglobia bacterium]